MQRLIEQELVIWKNKKSEQRLPIILRGARQVGKTYTVLELGRQFFNNTVIINFEVERHLIKYFASLNPLEIIKKIELFYKTNIVPGETLLFLDEIQECPEAIKVLRYFKEQLPELHVIAAGSLLEFILHDVNFSFPVGRVQFMYLGPLSFKEFLINLEQTKLIEYLANIDIHSIIDLEIHQYLIKYIKQYLLIGGMPAIIKQFISTNSSYIEGRNWQLALMQAYYNDFGKYSSKTQHKYLQRLFDCVPNLIGKHFKYASIDPDFRSRDLKIALSQLEHIGLVQRVYASKASGIPLKSQKQENKFKLIFLDVGLLQSMMQTNPELLLEQTLITEMNKGALAEQFVGQELLAYAGYYQRKELYFWVREKKISEAEVDYIVQNNQDIIPIEVKSGKTGRLKSLQQFMLEKHSLVGLKISEDPLSFDQARKILSVPFYLIMELPRLLEYINK